MKDLSLFYERAYGGSWDDILSEEQIYAYNDIFELMTEVERGLYDEYLWDTDNECCIGDALEFACGDRIVFSFNDDDIPVLVKVKPYDNSQIEKAKLLGAYGVWRGLKENYKLGSFLKEYC